MKDRSVQALLGLQFGPQSRVAQLSLALSLAALWLLGRRYAGMVHDATIYAAQGLRRLEPGLANDLFFSHGAQDAYTVFPALYAVLIDVLGTASAALVVTLAGQAAFVLAAAALAWRLVPATARWWSLALLAVMSGFYGGVGVFRVAEPFATARTLAEPLVVAALWATVSGRFRFSLAALALAALLHPLVAAPGVAVIFAWHAAVRPRLWRLAFAALAIGVALFALQPALRQQIDAAWLAPLVERSSHLFIAHWQMPDWTRLAWGACVVLLALRHVRPVRPDVRRLAWSVLLVAAAGIASSAILVDGASSALAAALQLWRAHWLLHLLAILLLPAVALSAWRLGGAGRAAAALLAASVCFGRAEQPAAVALALLAACFLSLETHRPGWLGEAGQRLVMLLALGAGASGLLFEVQARMPLRYGGPAHTGLDQLQAFTTVGGLLPLAILLWLVACSRYTRVAFAVAVLACAGAVAAWDARQPWPKFIDQAGAGGNPIRDAVPSGRQVYWPGPYGRSWLLLRRPEWFNVDQGAGIVFRRETALVYAERQNAVRELEAAVQNCAMRRTTGCRIALEPARTLCARPDGPDYLVLDAPIEGRPGLAWAVPAALGPSLHLYPCPGLRK